MHRGLFVLVLALLATGCTSTRYSRVEPIGGYHGSKQLEAINAPVDTSTMIHWYSGCDIGVGPRDGFGRETDRSWLQIEYTPSTKQSSNDLVLFFNGAHETGSGTNINIDYYISDTKDKTLNPKWRIERNKPFASSSAYDRLTISGFETVDPADPEFTLSLVDGSLFKKTPMEPYVTAPSKPRDMSDLNDVPKISAVKGDDDYRLLEVKYQGYIFHFVLGDAGGHL